MSQSNSTVDAHLKSLNLDTCTEAELADIQGLPQNLTATVASGQVTLRWDGVANAATYDLWVWDSIDLQWGPIGGALADTIFTHSVPVDKREDRSYYFQVRARDTQRRPGPMVRAGAYRPGPANSFHPHPCPSGRTFFIRSIWR